MEFLDHDDEEVGEDNEEMHYVVDDEEGLYVVVAYEAEQYGEEQHVVEPHEEE